MSAMKRALRRRRAEPPARISTPKPSLTYRAISYLLVFPVFRLLFRGRTAGNANVPQEGAVVVVANHGSHLDPPLLGHALGRPVAFMAKAELFKVPLLGPIIRACGAYPVSRGASDREAIRIATDRLEDGWATGVFLDGTRQDDGRVNTPMPGAALLAARAGVPLLPVAIINSHRAMGTGRQARSSRLDGNLLAHLWRLGQRRKVDTDVQALRLPPGRRPRAIYGTRGVHCQQQRCRGRLRVLFGRFQRDKLSCRTWFVSIIISIIIKSVATIVILIVRKTFLYRQINIEDVIIPDFLQKLQK
jgi:1-acyl-sn-glycerol-3-phosphate acyltransferase